MTIQHVTITSQVPVGPPQLPGEPPPLAMAARPEPVSFQPAQTALIVVDMQNAYAKVVKLLIHGARSCSMHLDRTKDRLGLWINEIEGRMHHNKLVVALANKLARIAWVILTKPGALYERRAPQLAS